MGGQIQIGHVQPDGTRWDEWETDQTPWSWIAVCSDPVIEARGRSLDELRYKETEAVLASRSSSNCFYGKSRPRLEGHLSDVAPEDGNPTRPKPIRAWDTVKGWPRWAYGGSHE